MLAGRTAGIKLDEVGRGQAARTGERLGVVPLVGVVSSPLERCRQTSRAILEHQTGSPYLQARSGARLVDNDPLDQPVEEQFGAGVMSLGWDPSAAQIVIEAFPYVEAADDDLDPVEMVPEEVLVVRIPVGTARAFTKRTREVVQAGRPTCPVCLDPMDADDHVCTLPDGFR